MTDEEYSQLELEQRMYDEYVLDMYYGMDYIQSTIEIIEAINNQREENLCH